MPEEAKQVTFQDKASPPVKKAPVKAPAQKKPGFIGKGTGAVADTTNKTVSMTTGTLNKVTDSATTGLNTVVNGTTVVAGKGLDKLPGGVGKPVKHVTDNVGQTATGATDNLYYTVGGATKGVQGTVSKTTNALSKGDVKGTAAGVIVFDRQPLTSIGTWKNSRRCRRRGR